MRRLALALLFASACGAPPSSVDAGVDAAVVAVDLRAPAPSSSVDLSSDPYGPYDRPGPGTYTRTTVHVAHDATAFDVEAHLPDGPGPFPVVLLAPGLLQPAAAYRPFAERLASHGIATLVRDDPGLLVDTPTVEADLVYLGTTFLSAASGPLAGRLDLSRMGLGGHSRGGKASLLAAEHGLHGKVKGWLGLDPVDAALLAGGESARDAIGALGVPTAFIGASVSSTCSPAADNYEVLFAAASPPSVALTGVGAGHTQLQDQAACVSCGLCTPAGTADAAAVLRYAVRYTTSFFARELLGDPGVGATFDGAGAPADVMAGLVTRESK